jgi:hypothetical protein
VWILAFFRSFRQLLAGCCFFSFCDKIFSPGWGCQPHAQPPVILQDQCFLSGLSPLAGWSQFGSIRNSLFALAWISRKNAKESQRGHASDLVGTNGITRDLIVHIHQQDVYPRCHILPLWPPFNAVTKMGKHEQAQVSHYGFTSCTKCREHPVNYSVCVCQFMMLVYLLI